MCFAYVDETLGEYRMQGERFVQLTQISCPGRPDLLLVDPHRRALLTRDRDRGGLLTMLTEGGGGWVPDTIIDEHIRIWSMCLPTVNALALFDGKPHSLKIFEFR